jgi:hypothetical protein
MTRNRATCNMLRTSSAPMQRDAINIAPHDPTSAFGSERESARHLGEKRPEISECHNTKTTAGYFAYPHRALLGLAARITGESL